MFHFYFYPDLSIGHIDNKINVLWISLEQNSDIINIIKFLLKINSQFFSSVDVL